ncbi:MAG: helix-turn-helix domain-containing protein [Lachnospiraceae bacterium]|nr:helix-turn-helix domain-containing protein [Lachnospiraceae bacterium]
MNRYVTGEIIKKFRGQEDMTQSQLAEKLMVSNKTISKWENGKGLPDISLLDALAKALNVSLIELMSGDVVNNSNMAASMNKTVWYVCPACGNVIHAMGDAVISCCGITLPRLEEEDTDENHNMIRTPKVFAAASSASNC